MQQEKTTEQIKAVRAQTEAKAHEAKATAAHQGQKAAQRRKESVK